MRTDLIAVPPFWTAGQVLDELQIIRTRGFFFRSVRRRSRPSLSRQYLSRQACPVLTQGPRRSINGGGSMRVRVDEDEEEVARIIARYNLVSVPVVR